MGGCGVFAMGGLPDFTTGTLSGGTFRFTNQLSAAVASRDAATSDKSPAPVFSPRREFVFWVAILCGILVFPIARLDAAVYNIGTIVDLTSRINRALPGDQIILSNGVYTTTGAINVSCDGHGDASPF